MHFRTVIAIALVLPIRRMTHKHCVERRAKTINIHSWRVGNYVGIQQQFWWRIVQRVAWLIAPILESTVVAVKKLMQRFRCEVTASVLVLPGIAKVHQLDIQAVTAYEHNILWLEVAVYEMLGVHMLNSLHQLQKDSATAIFIKRSGL